MRARVLATALAIAALELAGAKNPRGEISGRRQTPGAETWELEYTLRYD